MWRSLWYDDKKTTIRGSFINFMLTCVYAGLIIAGSFLVSVADNLHKIENLMIGFFVISIGIWSGKKAYEFSKLTSVDSVLKEHGIDPSILEDTSLADEEAAERAAEREAAK